MPFVPSLPSTPSSPSRPVCSIFSVFSIGSVAAALYQSAKFFHHPLIASIGQYSLFLSCGVLPSFPSFPFVPSTPSSPSTPSFPSSLSTPSLPSVPVPLPYFLFIGQPFAIKCPIIDARPCLFFTPIIGASFAIFASFNCSSRTIWKVDNVTIGYLFNFGNRQVIL